MYVHVIDHPYFAISASDGTFEIPQLPPGDYTLTAIHERCGRQSFSIHVNPKSETNQTLSFDDD